MGWLCTVLRNQFYTDFRMRKRELEDPDGAAAAKLATPAVQEHGSDLRIVWHHLGKLPPLQREALMLVAPQGMTYEAAAELMGCRVGTMKSRVSRARAVLAGSLGHSTGPPSSSLPRQARLVGRPSAPVTHGIRLVKETTVMGP